MTPRGLQAAPANGLAGEVTVCGGLCGLSRFSLCNTPPETKPTERPSGDQNRLIAPSVPGCFWAFEESMELSQRWWSSSIPDEAMRVPSGDKARLIACVLNGGANENRMARASGSLRV